ncbi:MAG: cysteine synthase A [Lachnospiraceae bacterium]|nr:cysteine synthase A [Lachnospiraceae bacterium]
MSVIYTSMEQLIGKTPLLELRRFEQKYSLKARVLGKLELKNATGSAKDRIAQAMLDDAAAKGLIREGTAIIEPTSGNTGIGLAAVGTARGYRTIIVMPDTMSVERRKLMTAYGAELVLSEGAKGMAGAIEKAKELAAQIGNAYIPDQFSNPANSRAHYETTGPEIWEDADGRVDIFVAGVGTGGTVSGTGKFLKEKNPSVRIVAVEPDTSPVLSGGTPGPHRIQGIGAGFIPKVLDRDVIDDIVRVTDEEAFTAARAFGHLEGLLVGISSGAALYAALRLAKDEENEGKTIVALLPDSGDRYLSTALFDEA